MSTIGGPIAKRLPVVFYETAGGSAPVRNWLSELAAEDRKTVGAAIKTVEFGWPIGMPLCRAIAGRKGLWEVRVTLAGGRIARVLFCILDGRMALLHGFEKTTQKTPERELDLAVRRMKGIAR